MDKNLNNMNNQKRNQKKKFRIHLNRQNQVRLLLMTRQSLLKVKKVHQLIKKNLLENLENQEI